MAILAGRTARFGAFAVLASAALLLSVAVPEAIAMEEHDPLITTGEQLPEGAQTSTDVNMGADTGPMTEGARTDVPSNFVPPIRESRGLGLTSFPLFKKFRKYQRTAPATLEGEGGFDDLVDGPQKKSFLRNLFGRGKKGGADQEQESEPKKRGWMTRLNPENWFRKKEPEPEPAASEPFGKCNLLSMTDDDRLDIGFPRPEYIVKNIKRGMKEIKIWEKKNRPFLLVGRKEQRRLVRNPCNPSTVISELHDHIVEGIPELSRNETAQNALRDLLEAVQYRISHFWVSCFKVKVSHRKPECVREEPSYKELVAKLPLCRVWNICYTIQQSLLPAGLSERVE